MVGMVFQALTLNEGEQRGALGHLTSPGSSQLLGTPGQATGVLREGKCFGLIFQRRPKCLPLLGNSHHST